MDSLWPWMAIAAAGALHGLNPAAGWLFAACARPRGTPRALLAIATGHVAAVAMAAAAMPVLSQLRLHGDRGLWLGALGAGTLLALAARRWCRQGRALGVLRSAGLAFWSFAMGSVHGAGLVLVPLLGALCATGAPTTGRTLLLALAAAGVHLAGMLASTALLAAAAQRLWAAAASSRIHTMVTTALATARSALTTMIQR